jgi:hypothetical protein
VTEPSASSPQSKKIPPQPSNGNYAGRTVRDHLCQIIRQHQLDATLVKSYATDFCGVKTLREATREQVESFVAHSADWAGKDRDALTFQRVVALVICYRSLNQFGAARELHGSAHNHCTGLISDDAGNGRRTGPGD